MMFAAVPKIASTPQCALAESVFDIIANSIKLLFLLPIVEQRSLNEL